MSSPAKQAILDRIRDALRDVPGHEAKANVTVERRYERSGSLSGPEVLELFAQRVGDYGGIVRRVTAADVAAAVGEACREMGVRRLGVPVPIPESWRPSGVEIVEDEGMDTLVLDGLEGVLTGCAAAIAQTGTLVLDGQGVSGRRALTLVPDCHICVVEAGQVVELVPEGLARVARTVIEHRLPVTLISGPSASSDIELTRVEGVHGPRHVLALLVESDA